MKKICIFILSLLVTIQLTPAASGQPQEKFPYGKGPTSMRAREEAKRINVPEGMRAVFMPAAVVTIGHMRQWRAMDELIKVFRAEGVSWKDVEDHAKPELDKFADEELVLPSLSYEADKEEHNVPAQAILEHGGKMLAALVKARKPSVS